MTNKSLLSMALLASLITFTAPIHAMIVGGGDKKEIKKVRILHYRWGIDGGIDKMKQMLDQYKEDSVQLSVTNLPQDSELASILSDGSIVSEKDALKGIKKSVDELLENYPNVVKHRFISRN